MICTRTTVPAVWKEYFKWNLAMTYAGCAIWSIPTHFLTVFDEIYKNN